MKSDFKILPLGTVVLLKKGKKRVMIIGYLPVDVNEKIVYDYAGCIYPEGFLGNQINLLFNNENISEIIFKGNEKDQEFIDFSSKAYEIYKEVYNKLNNNEIIDNELSSIPFE